MVHTENTSVPRTSDTPLSLGTGFITSINEDLLAGLVTDGNPLLMVLSSIHVLNHVNLLFSFLLLFTYISKIILSLNYELKWIEKILPAAYSGKIRLILLNSIKILSRVRDFNFILILLIMIVSQAGGLYFFSHVYLNLDTVIDIYTDYKNQN